MGEVWFGYDKRLDRPVAVKFIRIDRQTDGRPDDELTKRFVRESRITARLEHPGVPVVYDCGSHGEELYLVMQLVNGCPVSSLLDETEVPVAWAVAIAAQVCSVLAVAHANSLVHRDLKPSNLMLCPDGTVKVLDFGIVAALGSNAVTKLTATGIVVGSPDYMAPEQAMGEATSRRVTCTPSVWSWTRCSVGRTSSPVPRRWPRCATTPTFLPGRCVPGDERCRKGWSGSSCGCSRRSRRSGLPVPTWSTGG